MNVVDSSAWLEYLGEGPNASEFAQAIETPHELGVPTLTLFEVFKRTFELKGKPPRSMRSLPCCRGAWSISRPAWLSRPPGSSTKDSRWLIRSFLPRRAHKMRSFGLSMPTSADSRASSTEHRTLRTSLVSERGSRGAAHAALASRVSQQQPPERRQLSGGAEVQRCLRT